MNESRASQGRKWWQRSDEPWQTLAVCLEIAKVEAAIAEGRTTSAEYLCQLPLHQVSVVQSMRGYRV